MEDSCFSLPAGEQFLKKKDLMARTKHTTAQSAQKVSKATKTSKDGGITKKKKSGSKRKNYTMSRVNVKAVKEIRAQQKKTDVIIPKTAFTRLSKHHIGTILGKMDHGRRMSSGAKYILQQGVEATAIELFENAVYAKDLITHRQRLENRDFLGPIKNDPTLNSLFAPWVEEQKEVVMQDNEKRILERAQKAMDEKVEAARKRQKKKEEKEARKRTKKTAETEAVAEEEAEEEEGEEEEEEEPEESEKEKKKKKKKDSKKSKDKDKKKHKKRSKPASEDETELSSKQKSKKKKKKSKD